MKSLLLLLFLLAQLLTSAQTKPFRFAFISDTHIGSPNGGAEEDLRRTVADINSMAGEIAFVVLTGDITELGTNKELALAKQLLDSLKIPYLIIPGNHDTGWSETGGLGFTKVFGDDKFHYKYNGIHFIGCASGPYVRMSDGHVPRHNMNWLAKTLKDIGPKEPVIYLNHYPLDNGMDNWYEVIDLLKKNNTVLALCGHGHNNRTVKAEDIPSVMGRSNLRARASEGGYNLVDVRMDTVFFTERNPVSKTEKQWNKVALRFQKYDKSTKFPRPDFSINEKYAHVKPQWTYHSQANVISTPAVFYDFIVFGNQNGLIEALNMKNGKRKWTYQTGGPIFSSAAVKNDKIVIGSSDGFVYCLNKSGKLQWKSAFDAAVLGSPLIEDNIVYIGGSDQSFRAFNLDNGTMVWKFSGLQGPVVSKPVIADSIVLFGAWDRHLYALNKYNGNLIWKWNNGSTVINFSPASCIPVIRDEVVYIVAPDRYLSAIELKTGKTLWRSNEATVRESVGISADGKMIYGKTMQDTLVAFPTSKAKAPAAWKMHVGYGYEHAPSMLIEKNGALFFGTRNGVVYSIDPVAQKINWAHKIDNSMINTVKVIDRQTLVVSTMDGKVSLLKEFLKPE